MIPAAAIQSAQLPVGFTVGRTAGFGAGRGISSIFATSSFRGLRRASGRGSAITEVEVP